MIAGRLCVLKQIFLSACDVTGRGSESRHVSGGLFFSIKFVPPILLQFSIVVKENDTTNSVDYLLTGDFVFSCLERGGTVYKSRCPSLRVSQSLGQTPTLVESRRRRHVTSSPSLGKAILIETRACFWVKEYNNFISRTKKPTITSLQFYGTCHLQSFDAELIISLDNSRRLFTAVFNF